MANRIATCPMCGNQFEFGGGRGQKRTYCGSVCAKASAKRSKAAAPNCTVEGCGNAARSKSAAHCEVHYYRLRRTGSLELALPDLEVTHSHGYILEFAPDHPLAGSGGRAYQHRIVYHKHNGDGPFKCHWCGKRVTWQDMHVDHVNGVRDDNRIANLVASCSGCNIKRGHALMTETHRAKSTAKIKWRGECLTSGQWAERIGITRQSLLWRLDNGWPKSRALTEPRGVAGPKTTQRDGRYGSA